MEAKVRAFNNLPRPKTTPSGVIPNHWVFGVCHVDIQPAGDLVLAVNPQSQYLIQAGPGQILSSSGTREQAEATIPYLLDAFATPNAMEPSVPTFAPWTWSTLDPNMAKALEDGLKKHGVKPELCKVGVCTAEERDILETARAEMMDRLTGLLQRIERDPVSLGDATKCHSCGMKRECFFKPLMKCGRCGQAYYHSKECQKKDWKSHKSQCHAPGNIDVHTYHNTKAPDDPQACVLMKSLHLQSHPNLGVLALPLRRLVITGQDTPENLRLLFGPDYESGLKEEHENARIECLLDPPPGSPCHVMNASMYMDDPSLVRSPRPANEAEKKKVEEVRQMQALVRDRVGVGKSPSTSDMQAILKTFGPNWVSKMSLYTLAINTMDQGVPADGHRGF